MFTVLMVCTGNTCRSPMAAAIFQDIAAKSDYDDKIKVISAGISALAEPASQNACAVMLSRGLSLKNHCSEQLTACQIGAADLVLTMTSSHKKAVLRLSPDSISKVFTLPEFGYQNDELAEFNEIADPFGAGREEYERCANQIEKLVDKSLKKITELYLPR